MGYTIAQKIIKNHLLSGDMTPGCEIALKIDQTLTQDATGTMAYLQFEAMGTDRVKTELSVAYIDHNTLQAGFENADDHRYIQTVAKKHGIRFSRPGNGICHQVHLERFGAPGKTLIGSDSHTPTAGGIGMLGMGAGGLDVAVSMGGGAYYITMPKIIKINLVGKLSDYVGAKDVILEVLRMLGVKGGVGSIIEYGGEGVKTLTVPQRATITNMGAELGATSSVFPSDEITLEFLKAQEREDVYVPLCADEDAVYDAEYTVDLSLLRPLAACPHSPDNVKAVAELTGMKINQVCIGSCTNSSMLDMLTVAAILKGKTVHPDVSLSISPGSKQVYTMLAECGALADLISAGARILECACGPCIGMGFSPKSAGVSLRTFNRNFLARSGTKDAEVYLVSPETAAASAIAGVFVDPTTLGAAPVLNFPTKFKINDNLIEMPATPDEAGDVVVERGPNIKPIPAGKAPDDSLSCELILKVGDNITTDHIMPAGTKVLPYRSNVPKLSEFCFTVCDKDFPKRATEKGGGIILGGSNYGQGSSREHAALVPLYLGIKAVVAKSFARIHVANLINFGIVPMTLAHEEDYDKLAEGDEIYVEGFREAIEKAGTAVLVNRKNGARVPLNLNLTARQRSILLAGGMLNYTKNNSN
ncbi:MAG: aconitate hydratase [Clostridia bacterium]|nr:aconitate hydratase [Clostridia bacterium]